MEFVDNIVFELMVRGERWLKLAEPDKKADYKKEEYSAASLLENNCED